MDKERPNLITESVDKVFYSKDLLTLNSKQRDWTTYYPPKPIKSKAVLSRKVTAQK